MNGKTALARFFSGCCLLLVGAEAMAQGVMVPPPAVHAIESHLQQERTRQQRQTLEARRPVPVPSSPAKPTPPQAKRALNTAPSRFQNLDDEAIFERPAPPRAPNRPRGK